MAELDLAAIRARVEAATAGPWHAYDANVDYDGPSRWAAANDAHLTLDPRYDHLDVTVDCGTEQDAEFVAHARDDVPALLSEVERLRAELAWRPSTDEAIDNALVDGRVVELSYDEGYPGSQTPDGEVDEPPTPAHWEAEMRDDRGVIVAIGYSGTSAIDALRDLLPLPIPPPTDEPAPF